jgi:flavin reductase (DIM6/NTAB) family NADH-FMN oxidoreductase RutF
VDDGVSAFHAVVGRLDYPMLIVTTAAGGERAGCLVGFATQCSIDPARFLACVSVTNRTHRVLMGASALAVHVAPEDAGDLVELFGGETGDDADKFARCEWSDGPRGLPVLARCPSWFVGDVVERVPLGDHVGHVLEPVAGEAGGDGRAFPFQRARRIEPGHEA